MEQTQVHSTSAKDQIAITTAIHLENDDIVPLDFEDPHRAALEDNPQQAERLAMKTLLAVFFIIIGFGSPSTGAFALITGILVPVGTELGNVGDITWIVSGFSIAASVSFSIAGKASDVFGRRYILLSGMAFSILGSIVSAVAQTTMTLVVGSTIVGWAIGIVFVGIASISELLPNKWRNIGIGLTDTIVFVPWGAGAVIIATLLNTRTSAGWRWCYYISIIYGAVGFIGTAIFYFPPSRPQHDHERSRWEQVKDLDYIGITLYTLGLTILEIGLTWGGSTGHPWTSASTLAPIILGFFTMCACFIYDFSLAQDPMFPPKLLKMTRKFTLLLVIVFVAGMVYFSMSGLSPQVTLYSFTKDPIQIGITALPSGFGITFFGGVFTLFIGKIGHLKMLMLALLVIQTVSIALYSVAVPGNKTAWMAFQFFGYGPFAPITILCYLMAGLNVPLKYLGVATGLIGTFRCLGGAVGTSLFSAILSNLVDDQLPRRIGEAAEKNGFPASSLSILIPAAINDAQGAPNAFAAVSGVTTAVEAAVQNAVKEAYGYALKRVFWSSIPFGVLAIICAFFLHDPSQYLTNHTAVHMEKGGMADHTAHASEVKKNIA